MSFSASIPAANLDAANTTLEDAGFGPGNFSVPVYGNLRATHATLHAWTDATFQTAVEALPGVTVSSTGETPKERVQNATAGQGQYAGDATPLEGTVSPGLHVDADGVLWWVIQGYDTTDPTNADPNLIPALIRRARIPGETLPWVQPIDQFDAYQLEDPFTGEPEMVSREIAGEIRYFKTAIDNNVTIPGDPSSGPPFNYWIEVDAEGNVVEPPAPPPGDTWTASGATFQGVVGGGVIWVSDTSLFQTPEPIRIGGIEITANSIWTPGAPGILAVSETSTDLQFNTPNGTPIEVQR